MENPVLIIGAGDLGKKALNIFQNNNVLVYGLLDDKKELQGKEIDGVSILGNVDDPAFLNILGTKCEVFVAIGENKVHEKIVDNLKETYKVMPVNAIHNSALVAPSASIGHGNLIDARTIIGSESVVGNHCSFLPASVIDTSVTIGDYVTISTGAIINDRVKIADGVFIGSGAVIVAGVEIGKNARIGIGSVVVENVPAKSTYFGNPAKKI